MNPKREAMLSHMREVLRNTDRSDQPKRTDFKLTTQQHRIARGEKYLLPYQQYNAYRELRDWLKDETLSDDELIARIKEKATAYGKSDTLGGDYNTTLFDFWNVRYYELTCKYYYQ